MASIVRQRVGKYTYLYESVSYRDENKQPRNRRKRIGKVDLKTGRDVYDDWYLERLTAEGKPLPSDAENLKEDHGQQCGADEVAAALDTVRSYGNMWLLEEIGRQEQVVPLLKNHFPDAWEKIFGLAAFVICTSEAMMYYDDWAQEQYLPEGAVMSSQRISEFFDSLSEEARNGFYRDWMKLLPSVEYLAPDITSISSYSELMGNVEWGCNRDREKLAQVNLNLCMLFSEDSELPCFQIAYSGSVTDVATLLTTIDELRALLPGKQFRLVMDKGFYSEPNVQELLDQSPAVHFITAVPFSTEFAKEQVDLVRTQIDNANCTVVTGGETVRGIHKVRSWGSKREKLHVYVFQNPETALRAKNELYRYVKTLEAEAHADPHSRKWRRAFDRYLVIRQSKMSPSGVTVKIREDVLEEELRCCGWLVLLSTVILTPSQALEICRRKDVAEKSFDRLKRGFGMRRLGVHSDERAENKLFVGFIAQILISSLNRRMREVGLFQHYTVQKVLHVLARVKIANTGTRKYYRPLTAEQKRLFDKLGIPQP